MIYESPVCMNCKHYNEFDIKINSCTAFPKGIPDKIFIDGNEHKTPLKEQDNKIVFELRS